MSSPHCLIVNGANGRITCIGGSGGKIVDTVADMRAYIDENSHAPFTVELNFEAGWKPDGFEFQVVDAFASPEGCAHAIRRLEIKRGPVYREECAAIEGLVANCVNMTSLGVPRDGDVACCLAAAVANPHIVDLFTAPDRDELGWHNIGHGLFLSADDATGLFRAIAANPARNKFEKLFVTVGTGAGREETALTLAFTAFLASGAFDRPYLCFDSLGDEAALAIVKVVDRAGPLSCDVTIEVRYPVSEIALWALAAVDKRTDNMRLAVCVRDEDRIENLLREDGLMPWVARKRDIFGWSLDVAKSTWNVEQMYQWM